MIHFIDIFQNILNNRLVSKMSRNNKKCPIQFLNVLSNYFKCFGLKDITTSDGVEFNTSNAALIWDIPGDNEQACIIPES